MRVLAHVTVPVEQGNRALHDGSMAKLTQHLMEQWHPEAMYSGLSDGQRSTYVVFDLASPAQVPAFCEPLFEQLNARIEITPVMNAQDLQQGFSELRR